MLNIIQASGRQFERNITRSARVCVCVHQLTTHHRFLCSYIIFSSVKQPPLQISLILPAGPSAAKRHRRGTKPKIRRGIFSWYHPVSKTLLSDREKKKNSCQSSATLELMLNAGTTIKIGTKKNNQSKVFCATCVQLSLKSLGTDEKHISVVNEEVINELLYSFP